MKRKFESSTARVNSAFKFIRETFFPKWDKVGSWRVKIKKDLSSQGICNARAKSILIQREKPISGSLFLLLVHGICHSVAAPSGHGKRWKERMLRAAGVANRIDCHRIGASVDSAAGG
jgi:hypothetical protein